MKRLKLTLVSTIAIFLVAIALCQICEWCGLPEQNQVEVVRKLAGWNLTFAFLCVQVVVVMPAIEEMLFRFPTRFLKHPAYAVALSAVFSFCHYIDFTRLFAGRGFDLLPLSNAFLALFVVALGWCWLYRRTQCIWCTMLSHGIFNAINLVLALVLPAST